jgi:diguanylate cyclase (GGDEF)-like protein/PAS domain S-box-containing protein
MVLSLGAPSPATANKEASMDNTPPEEIEQRRDDIYRSLVDRATEGLFMCRPDGRFLFFNQAMASLAGFENVDAMTEAEALLPDLLEDPERWNEVCAHLLAGGNAMTFEARLRQGSELRWVSVHAQAVHDIQDHAVIVQGSVRDISERKLLESQLLQESWQDALTGLANRAMFLNHLDKAIARARRRNFTFALITLDIDRFRRINESLGHKAGDQVLSAVAGVLVGSLRIEDMCARLGGDEFALYLSDVDQTADAIRVVERIGASLQRPVPVAGDEIFVNLHAGVVMNAGEYANPENMLRDAESAMYRAKTDQQNRFAVFSETMQHEAMQRLRVETDLRLALERGELRLYYQPIVSLSSGRMASFEALLRWERPGVGMIQPAEFVPLLEETGLIVPVGEWVLQQACAQLKAWQERFPELDLQVNVNVSGRQFDAGTLPRLLDEALRASGLEPASVKLEVTESVVMSRAAEAEASLAELKSRGVGLAIDDFGTGYSSLSYLQRFPVDVLKIDKSFIFGMRQRNEGFEIVRAIVTLAHQLGKEVVAEGVETSWHVRHLLELGCEWVQGYYFAKPMDERDATMLLAKSAGN